MTNRPGERYVNLVPRSVGRYTRLIVLWGVLLGALPSQAQDGHFISRDLQLHYRSIGTGTPVVILSGGPGFEVDYMRPVAEMLPGYRRILLEQRGTGRSRLPKLNALDMTLEVAVADLEALREHLGQSRLILVGHSWGGMLAMAYAAAHPDRIDRLVLIGSGGPTLEFVARFQDNIRARMRPEDVEAERYWAEAGKQGVSDVKVAHEANRVIVPAYFFDRAKGLAFAAAIPQGSFHVDVNSLLVADLSKQYDLRSRLGALDRPTLIVHGHQDPMGDKTAEDIHDLIKSSTLVYINQSGHFPWIEQPEVFGRAIKGFLNDGAKD
jgi:proline iminopeptidase